MVNKIGKFLLIIACVAVSACSANYSNKSPVPSVSDEAKAGLRKPINCRTARQDIKTLQEERASTGKQALSGVRSVMPIGVVAGLLMGDYSDRVEVATGQYNTDIDNKITEISQACGVSTSN